jgi:hypothetical protein
MTLKKTKTINLNFQGKFTLEELRDFIKETADMDGTATVSVSESRWYAGEGTSVGFLSVTGDI